MVELSLNNGCDVYSLENLEGRLLASGAHSVVVFNSINGLVLPHYEYDHLNVETLLCFWLGLKK